jgi:hypothetical protein
MSIASLAREVHFALHLQKKEVLHLWHTGAGVAKSSIPHSLDAWRACWQR